MRTTPGRFAVVGIGSVCVLTAALAAQPAVVGPPPSAPGRLVDIGGQRIHLDCAGRGSPTVVFENGAGDFSVVWSLVQPRVSVMTRACSYDRAGYAWSDPGARPRTYDQIALELHTALQHAGEHGPYVLVGQSYGGLLVRGFARQYASEVSGIVLVDAMHEDERINMGGDSPQRIRDFATHRVRPAPRIAADSTWLAIRAHVAPPNLDEQPLERPLDRLSPPNQDVWRRASADSVYRLTWAAEMDWSPEELQRMHDERTSQRSTLGDIPLVVISRAPAHPAQPLDAEHAALQRDLVALSRRGTHVVARKAGHNVHLEEPALVVEQVGRLVKAVRRPRS